MSTPTRSVRRTVRAALLAVVLASGAGACGSSGGTAGTTTTTTGGGGGASGTIVAMDFSLSDLTVAPGAMIVLQNDGSATHTATADDGSFEIERVDGGGTSAPVKAPDQPGTYPFHCEIHSSMTATLTVQG